MHISLESLFKTNQKASKETWKRSVVPQSILPLTVAWIKAIYRHPTINTDYLASYKG